MNMPETYKDIEIDGRKFRIKKMDARTGSYILFVKILPMITPIFKNIKVDSIDNIDTSDFNLEGISDVLSKLSEKDFRYIQDNSLKVTYELLGAGEAPVIQSNGDWGINDIEFNGALVMSLTIQSLYFNLKGFFPGSLLASISEKLTTSQQN